nr:MAG TPA: hypothetical protein [Caudoviricetes sp.]
MKLEHKINNLLGKRYDFITIDDPIDMHAIDMLQYLQQSIYRNMTQRDITRILHLIHTYEHIQSLIGHTEPQYLHASREPYVLSGELQFKPLNMPQREGYY